MGATCMIFNQIHNIVFRITFILAISLSVTNIVLSQTQQDLASADLSKVKVEQIPDAQLRRFMQEAQNRGLTQQEIEIALRTRGMPSSEIEKLKNRLYTLQTGAGVTGGLQESRLREEAEQEALFEGLMPAEEDEEIIESRVFGMNLFQSKYLTFEPSMNIPTPKDYQIGPGDEMIIDIWGASEQTYQQTVSPDGYIKIPNLGPIYLSGLSVERASARIKSRLTKIYSGLKPPDGSAPNTFAQISLGQLRSIKVAVIGEVMNPGVYTVSSLATIFNALYLAGGPNEVGSLRQIELIREGKVVANLDLYDAVIKGREQKSNRLYDQDRIRVSPYISRVEINGEVKREGIYEMKEGETFNDLITFTGGFTENAYKATIKVKRNTEQERIIQDFDRETFFKTEAVNGDYVFIESILNRFTNRVQISGAVFRPGEFELMDGLTLCGLIEKADGLRGDAYLERGSIYRTLDDFSTEVIPFNVREIQKDKSLDIELHREDLVRISSIYDLDEESYVSIQGEVRIPGIYPFMYEMSIEDLVFMAGGLRESASESKVEVSRRIITEGDAASNQVAEIFNFTIDKALKLKNGDKSFILSPFDFVFIRKSPAYEIQRNVRVEGEIKFPGSYTIIRKNERISDLISRAGGLTNDAYIKGATLIRRTEFNPPSSDYEQKLQDLRKLRSTLNISYRDRQIGELNEAESERDQRLDDLDRIAFQFRDDESTEYGQEGIRIRQQRLTQLAQRDTLTNVTTNIRYESIGIDMGQILKNPGSKFDVILQDGDIISIPRELETVRLRGEFLYPNTVRFDDKLGFKDYVSQAGGFSINAKKSKAYVLYANGSVNRTKKVLIWNIYPKVEPGTDIIVPSKPQKQPMSVQAWIALSTSVATLALVIQNLIK
jgi:protein involved in polysaccharide export with SLBB domain